MVASSVDRLPLGFQGGWTDSQTGLLNAHARWYHPPSAAFVSRDTWTLSPDPVAQANRYGYGNASPLNNIDTDGHNPLALSVGALGGLLGLSNPVGWGVLIVVSVGAAAYVTYDAYQWYQHRQAAGSASSWGGLNTTPTTAPPRTYVQDDYAARAAAAARAQAAVAYQQAATQARINARVAEMTAAYYQWLAAYLAAARAERARKFAEEEARIEADRKAYDIRVAAQTAAPGAGRPLISRCLSERPWCREDSANEVQHRRVRRIDEMTAGDKHVLRMRKGLGEAVVHPPQDFRRILCGDDKGGWGYPG